MNTEPNWTAVTLFSLFPSISSSSLEQIHQFLLPTCCHKTFCSGLTDNCVCVCACARPLHCVFTARSWGKPWDFFLLSVVTVKPNTPHPIFPGKCTGENTIISNITNLFLNINILQPPLYINLLGKAKVWSSVWLNPSFSLASFSYSHISISSLSHTLYFPL